MRIAYAFVVYASSTIYYGCSSDEDDTGAKRHGADSEQVADLDPPFEISYPETIKLGKGCQRYVYEGGSAADLMRFQSSNCYSLVDPAATTGYFDVTVYYQRHAESTWNADHRVRKHSDLTDAHLTEAGIQQAITAHDLVSSGMINGDAKDKQILSKGSYASENVVFATSNLRRSTLTFLITFKHLLKSMKKVHILSALQETTGNIDCNPLAGPNKMPKLSFASSPRSPAQQGPTCPFEEDDMKKLMETRCNNGNEKMRPRSSGEKPKKPIAQDPSALTHDLCKWMFNVVVYGEDFMDPTIPHPLRVVSKENNFVITGHGQYFRTLFRNFFDNYRYSGVIGRIPINLLEDRLYNANYRLKNSSIIRFKVRITKNGHNSLYCSLIPTFTTLLTGEIAQLPFARRQWNNVKRLFEEW